MEEVLDRLWVGGDKDYERVDGRQGWSWLRCCKEGQGGHRWILGYNTLGAPKDKHYLWVRKGNLMALNLLDLDDPNFMSREMIDKGLDFIDERMKAGDKVLVACNAGHSRGPTTAMMYLRRIGELPDSFIQSEKIYRTLYRHYYPGQGMRQFARMNWHTLKKG
jgi:hypothetical protein